MDIIVISIFARIDVWVNCKKTNWNNKHRGIKVQCSKKWPYSPGLYYKPGLKVPFNPGFCYKPGLIVPHLPRRPLLPPITVRDHHSSNQPPLLTLIKPATADAIDLPRHAMFCCAQFDPYPYVVVCPISYPHIWPLCGREPSTYKFLLCVVSNDAPKRY
jgi:hypothetical protein